AVGVLRVLRQYRVIGLHDVLVGVGGDGELAAAFAGRESVQGGDVVMADADHAGAERGIFVDGVGEFVRLDGAAGCERGRIKVQNDRTLFERGGEREGELLAAERGLR